MKGNGELRQGRGGRHGEEKGHRREPPHVPHPSPCILLALSSPALPGTGKFLAHFGGLYAQTHLHSLARMSNALRPEEKAVLGPQ